MLLADPEVLPYAPCFGEIIPSLHRTTPASQASSHTGMDPMSECAGEQTQRTGISQVS